MIGLSTDLIAIHAKSNLKSTLIKEAARHKLPPFELSINISFNGDSGELNFILIHKEKEIKKLDIKEIVQN